MHIAQSARPATFTGDTMRRLLALITKIQHAYNVLIAVRVITKAQRALRHKTLPVLLVRRLLLIVQFVLAILLQHVLSVRVVITDILDHRLVQLVRLVLRGSINQLLVVSMRTKLAQIV